MNKFSINNQAYNDELHMEAYVVATDQLVMYSLKAFAISYAP